METSDNISDLITGKVASILNAREIAINVGSINGVKSGMKFKILAPKPLEIIDPDTNKKIGSIDREKIRVQAIIVQENITICKTYRLIQKGSSYSSVIAKMMVTEDVPETLKTDGSEFPPPLSENESFVKRGDRVIQLKAGEE